MSLIPNNIYTIGCNLSDKSKREVLTILAEDQTHNLVYDDGEYRIWLSRMSPEDYDKDWDAYNAEKIMFEKLVDGKWILTDKHGNKFYK